jgi:hypothetical protein
VNEVILCFFVPPARPGESCCSGGRRRRGFRTRWPLSVAVTGGVNAVTAVTWGRDPALDVTRTVGWWRPAARSRLVTGWSRRGAPFSVTAGHVAAGRVTAVTSADQRPRPLPLATLESRAHGRSLARPESRSICAARVAKPA